MTNLIGLPRRLKICNPTTEYRARFARIGLSHPLLIRTATDLDNKDLTLSCGCRIKAGNEFCGDRPRKSTNEPTCDSATLSVSFERSVG